MTTTDAKADQRFVNKHIRVAATWSDTVVYRRDSLKLAQAVENALGGSDDTPEPVDQANEAKGGEGDTASPTAAPVQAQAVVGQRGKATAPQSMYGEDGYIRPGGVVVNFMLSDTAAERVSWLFTPPTFTARLTTCAMLGTEEGAHEEAASIATKRNCCCVNWRGHAARTQAIYGEQGLGHHTQLGAQCRRRWCAQRTTPASGGGRHQRAGRHRSRCHP